MNAAVPVHAPSPASSSGLASGTGADSGAHPLPLHPVLGRTTRGQWASVFAVLFLVEFVNLPYMAQMATLVGVRTTAWDLAAYTGGHFLAWSALVVPLFWLFDRTPVAAGRRAASVGIRLAALALVAAGYWFANVRALPLLGVFGAWGARKARLVTELALAPLDGAAMFLLVLIAHALLQRTHRTQRTIRWAAELREAAAQARLHALALELQPHFLFNALNGIAELVRSDPPRAERMVLRLGDLLRHAVDARRATLQPLRDELAQLDRYLALQEMRFGDRLTVVRDVAPEALDAAVPGLLLQPLVENALTHGLEPRPGPGRLVVAARRGDEAAGPGPAGAGTSGAVLVLEVRDDGVGPAPADRRRTGVGIANTRARLQALAPWATLTLEAAPGGGTRVVAQLPWIPTATTRGAAEAAVAGGFADAPARAAAGAAA